MISEVAYQLMSVLAGKVLFFDKWGGIVVPLRKSVNGTEKVFPVFQRTPSDCDKSVFMDLVPDSSKTSIAYIEVLSEPTFEPLYRSVWLVSTSLRVVVWYNLDRIAQGLYLSGDAPSADVLTQMPRSLPNSALQYCKNVQIYPVGFKQGASLFDAYTYDEVRTQFVTHPYGACAVDVDVQYTISQCATTITPELKCNQPDYVD